jgi:UDP-2,3-diacylglucosamine pyrophosphatase LpxH
MKEKDKIVLVGDIHGAYPRLRYDISRLHTDAHIIQVGDFGFGFHKPNYYKTELEDVSKTLAKTNCHLYIIRGNHDDPSYFAETNNPFEFDNITTLADYSELSLLGKSILLVGGAVSVDRRFRQEGKSWWSDEDFNLKLEDQFPYKDRQYDLVVTHTRPGVCGAFKGFDNIQYWCDQDPTLKNDLIDESQQLDYLYERTKPRDWIYGHFHCSDVHTYQDTKFRCINIDEHYPYHYNE